MYTFLVGGLHVSNWNFCYYERDTNRYTNFVKLLMQNHALETALIE